MKFKPSYTSSIAEDIMAERLIRAQAEIGRAHV